MKSLFHILGTLSLALMNVLTDPQVGTCIDHVLVLNQQELEHIGFEFQNDEILFQFSIDDLKQEFHLENGEHWTTIKRYNKEENPEQLNYNKGYLPMVILNTNCEVLYSSSLIKKRRDLLPILLKSSSEAGEQEFVYFLLYNKNLQKLLPNHIRVEDYIVSSEDFIQANLNKENERI